MLGNSLRWARGWNACRNCETTRRPHKARGYCSYCYRFIRQLAKIGSWTEKDFPDLAGSSLDFLSNNMEKIKDACKEQINNHMARVRAVEKRLNGPIDGLSIEYQLNRIARSIKISKKRRNSQSLFHGIAGYIDDNFHADQRIILYKLLNKIEEQRREVPIDWNAVWKKVFGEGA
jgi:hypothetical protein